MKTINKAIKVNFCEWSVLSIKEYNNLSIRKKIIFNQISGVVIKL